MHTNQSYRLIALDLDGTLLNSEGTISNENKTAIQKAAQQGVSFAIATGRPYCGLPLTVIKELDIRYAITTNGAGIYTIPDKNCLAEHCMPANLVIDILKKLLKLEIHMDLFIHGNAYTPAQCRKTLDKITVLPKSLKKYIYSTRKVLTDPLSFLLEGQLPVQKLTLNFMTNPDGTYKDREQAIQVLSQYPEISYLTGGYGNLEFTLAGITKAKGLSLLCRHLNISVKETIACGDSENDLDIIKAAGLGIAMANAPEDIRGQADAVTLSNDAHGVAVMLERYLGIG
ncbi:MAG: HAD family phosphatase [Lachnospiraceae bacterium]|nr:HAD family phosphatase [Lachnospiraceae bacterium]